MIASHCGTDFSTAGDTLEGQVVNHVAILAAASPRKACTVQSVADNVYSRLSNLLYLFII